MLLLAQGVSVRVVVETLRHSRVIDNAEHRHVLPALQQDAASTIDISDTLKRERFMAKVTNCPVCGLALDGIERVGDRDAFRLSCQRCGNYGITGSMLPGGFGGANQAERAGLMAAL